MDKSSVAASVPPKALANPIYQQDFSHISFPFDLATACIDRNSSAILAY